MRSSSFAGVVLACAFAVSAGGARGDDKKEAGPERFAALIKQLGAAKFSERQTASKELEAIGEKALAALRKAVSSDDAEVRKRAEALVEAITQKAAREAPSKLVGTWKLAKCKWGDGKWENSREDHLALKKITATGFTWMVTDVNTKGLVQGATGTCSIGGNTYVEIVESASGAADRSIVGLKIPYTWEMKGREWHAVADFRGTRVEQVWVPAD